MWVHRAMRVSLEKTSVARSIPSSEDLSKTLRAEFDEELERLISSAGRAGAIQGVMRLRALAEISAALSTEALVALAVAVGSNATVSTPEPSAHRWIQ